ncbi:MAG: hypothetical protein MHM6MM_001451 [Cercozoa sp. M6MM]
MQCSICGLAGELVLSASKQHGAHFACCKRVVPDFLLPLSDSKLRQMREKIGLSREIPSADTVKSQVDVRMEAAAPLLLRGDRVFAAQLEKHSRRTWCFRDESKKETPFAPTESKETVSVNSFVAVDSNDPGRPNIASIVSIFHKASMKGSEASISNKNWQLGLRLFVRPEQSQLASTEVNLNEVPLEQTLLQLQPPAETVVALSHVLFKVAVVTRQEYRQILAAHHDEDRVHPHPAVRFFDSFEKRRVFCCHRSCSLGVFLGRTPSDKCVLGPLARFSSSFQKTQKLRLRRAAKDARMPAKSVPGRISRKQLRQKVKVSTSWRRQWDAVFSAVFDAATLKRLRVLMRALINVDTTSAMEKRYLQLNCTNLADTPQHETHAVSGTHKGHVSDSQLFSAVAKRVGLQRPSRATAHSLCDTYNIDHKLASTLWTVAADFPLAALQEYLSHLLQEQQDRKLPQQTLGASVMQDSDEEFELPEQRRQRAQREQQRKQRQLERQHKLALEKRWADEIDGDVLLRRCDLATGEAEKGDCLALLNAFLSHTLSGLNNYQFGKVTDDTAARKHLSEIGVMQVIARACSHVCRWLHVPSSTSTVQTPSAMLLVAACADTLVTVLRAVTCPTRSTDTLDAMLARHDPNKPVERNDSEIDVIRSIQETRECLQLRQMPKIAQPDVVVKKRVALLSGGRALVQPVCCVRADGVSAQRNAASGTTHCRRTATPRSAVNASRALGSTWPRVYPEHLTSRSLSKFSLTH